MKLIYALLLCLAMVGLQSPGFAQKPPAKAPPKMALVEHYECAKCHSTWTAREAKDPKSVSRCCKAKMAKEHGASSPGMECKRCHVKWDIIDGQKLKGKCAACKGPLSPYSPPTHWECTKCQAQWAEREAINVKRQCPACKKPMRMQAGPVNATHHCAHCKLKWSHQDADKLRMTCPKCKAKIKQMVTK